MDSTWRKTTMNNIAHQTSPPHAMHGRRGMTLAEVLIASVILGVGVAGLLSVASLSLRNQQRTEFRAAALCLAQEKLAEVEMEGPAGWKQAHPINGTQEMQGAVYSWSAVMEPIAVGELYSVQVKVDWAAVGSTGRVQLETLLNDYEETDLAGENPQPNANQQTQRQVRP